MPFWPPANVEELGALPAVAWGATEIHRNMRRYPRVNEKIDAEHEAFLAFLDCEDDFP